MNEEFEQLLEAEWEGRLDAAGRQRLDALCAADPALAERLNDERRMSGLLASVGPNRPPGGLADRVFARLDGEAAADEALAEAPPAPPPARAPRERARERRSLWDAWRFPVFGLGSALAAAGLLVVFAIQNRAPEDFGSTARPVMADRVADATATSDAPPLTREVAMAPTARATPRSTPALPPTDGGTVESEFGAAAAGESRAARIDQRPAATPAATTSPTPAERQPIVIASAPPDRDAVPGGQERAEQPAAAAKTLAATSAAGNVAAEATGETAALPTVRRVALQISLPPLQAPGNRGNAAGAVGQTQTLSTPDPNGVRALSPGAILNPATPANAPTRRDIETAVATAGGTIHEIRPMPERPGFVQVRCSVSPDQLQAFLNSLETMGLRPAATSREAATMARTGASRPIPEAAAPAQGSPAGAPDTSLDRFERLRALGVQVERSGAAPTETKTAPMPATTSVRPGQYAVLEGDTLVEALGPTAKTATKPQAAGALAPTPRAGGTPVELLLLIQQP
jgi:hypothetical protein